jgi:hypothetical protein
MLSSLLKSFRRRPPMDSPPPRQPVDVDRSTPAGTLRSLALSYIHGDPKALLACVDESGETAWPRGRVEGWAAFVEAAGRLRRAADAAFGAGCGDPLVREILLRDPKDQGIAMLDLLNRGAFAKVDHDTPAVAVSESFVLGPTWLMRTTDGWRISGGPETLHPPPKIDPQLLREAMDRSDRLVVADTETAHLLADGIESGGISTLGKAKSIGLRERSRAHERAGCDDRKFTQRLMKALGSEKRTRSRT